MKDLSPQALSGYMSEALAEAKKAEREDEVPVGAVVVREGEVIARAYNQTEGACDPTAHAEILAIRAASQMLQKWRLNDCQVFVTLEPCPMCAAALLHARIPVIVFGAPDERMGALGSIFDLTESTAYAGQPRVIGNVCAKESAELLQTFFKGKRL